MAKAELVGGPAHGKIFEVAELLGQFFFAECSDPVLVREIDETLVIEPVRIIYHLYARPQPTVGGGYACYHYRGVTRG